MKRAIVFFASLLIVTSVWAQRTLSGSFTAHPGAEIRLKGFHGFTEQVFSNDTIKEDGSFVLRYPEGYVGMGAIEIKEQGSFLLILAHEKMHLKGANIQDHAAIAITNSTENQYFDTYLQQQGIRNKKLDGWKWLKPFYGKDDGATATLAFIQAEIQRLEVEEAQYLAAIPADKYTAYYLPLRKLIEDRPASTNRYVERIPQHIKDFKTYPLASKKLWQSGMMGELYDGHFIMLENVSVAMYDSAYVEINASIDHVIEQLMGHDDQLLAVSEHLFKLFEKRSLFPAAEYLSLKMLEQNACTVEGELQRRFEQYRSMKEGNTAPDILFTAQSDYVRHGFKKEVDSLTDINSPYKLVVFWASKCSHCMDEIPKLQQLYPKLQEKKVEVIAISLDTDRQTYLSTAADHPWYSYCDFKEWESPAVQDYYVFATPGFYLLDKDNRIVKKIISVAQLEAIADFYL